MISTLPPACCIAVDHVIFRLHNPLGTLQLARGLNGVGIGLAPLMLTVHSPLFFSEMAETEHLPLWAAIVVSNVPSLARPYEYQMY